MKLRQKGFTYIEVVLAIAIIGSVGVVSSGAIFQIFKGIDHDDEHLTAVGQVHNAGYWISRDTQMAQSVSVDGLTLPDFLVLTWTEWDAAGDPVYHSARYFFADMVDGLGKLKRNHWSSAGANEETFIAEHVYYDPSDVDNTTKVSYLDSVLTLQLTAFYEGIQESREYRIIHRPNFY